MYGPSNGPWWPLSKKNCIIGTFELYTVHAQSKSYKIADIWTICIFLWAGIQ